MSKRYQVKVIASGRFGQNLTETDEAAVAKQAAEELASAYYYGTAIIDTQTGMADLGDRVVPVGKAFEDVA